MRRMTPDTGLQRDEISPSLARLRAEIDVLDEAVVSALITRFALALAAAEHKRVPTRDDIREAEVLDHVERFATQLGGDGAAARSIYRLILNVSLELQRADRSLSSGEASHEREFWSTFGEAGICVFWGLSAEALGLIDASTRGRLVTLTNEVAFGDVRTRDDLLAEFAVLSDVERVNALCRLVGVEGP
jgi:chorismate mutase